jgi:hypothetical protein
VQQVAEPLTLGSIGQVKTGFGQHRIANREVIDGKRLEMLDCGLVR